MGILRSQRDDPATKFILSRLTSGGTFFDLGANHGWFTLRAAQKYREIGSGTVFAFEPQQKMFEHLSMSVQENSFSDVVKLYNLALGDDDKEVMMTTSELNSGGSQVIYKTSSNFLPTVRMRRFDNIAPAVEKVDCIKIDIEGAEPLFLSGAKCFIEKYHPVIYSEINQRKLRKLCGVNGTEYIQDLELRGYRTFSIARTGETLPFDDHSEVNNPGRVFNVVFEPT